MEMGFSKTGGKLWGWGWSRSILNRVLVGVGSDVGEHVRQGEGKLGSQDEVDLPWGGDTEAVCKVRFSWVMIASIWGKGEGDMRVR